MKRYIGWFILAAGVFVLLGSLMGIMNGDYLSAILFSVLGGGMILYGLRENKKASYYAELDDNPLSSSKPRIRDQKIIDMIRNQDYDPVMLNPIDLNEGSFLEYDTKQWITERMRVIYWKEGGSSSNNLGKRVRIDCKGEELHIDALYGSDDEKISIAKEVNATSVIPNLDQYMVRGSFEPPEQVTYSGQLYYREGAKVGYSIDPRDYSYDQFKSFDYFNDDKRKLLRMESWGHKNFHAWVGDMVDENQFSNILPAPAERKLLPG